MQTEIGGGQRTLTETPERFQRLLPKENTVRVRNLIKRYEMGTQTVDALRGVNFQIQRGEYISIMGPSGSGKSTLFNMIGGLDKPTEGRVYIDEVDIAQLDAYELAWLRCRKIGYIFQSFNLIPVMTALENVSLPMIFAGMSADESRDKGVDLLSLVGLGDRVQHKPLELSGGSSSVLQLRVRSLTTRRLSSRMNLRVTWIPKPDLKSSHCSADSMTKTA